MVMLLQIAFGFMLITGSALSLSSKKTLDVPNYLRVILASYKVPKEAFQKESGTQKIEASGEESQVDSLLQLRRDPYLSYNLTYQIRDPIGRISYRNEYSDGEGSLRGSMNFTKDNGSKMTVLNYSLDVDEYPVSSPETNPEQIDEPNMRSSAGGIQMTEEISSQEEGPRIIYVSRAPQKLKSVSMDNKGYLFQKEKYLSPPSDMKSGIAFDDLQPLSSQLVEDKEQPSDYLSDDMKGPATVYHMKPKPRGYEQVWKRGQGLVVDREYELPSSFDDLQARSSQLVEDWEQPADNLGDDMQGPATVYHMKPKPRGYEQVWKRGQGLVVDREYELPESYDYRGVIKDREDFEDGENEQPLYVYHTKPTVQVFEMSRDLDGNYQVPEKYNNNIKQQGFEDDDGEEPLYMTHSKPAVHVRQLSSGGEYSKAIEDGGQGQYYNDFDESDNQDSASSSVSQDGAFPEDNNSQIK